jgi:hypothetical protein
MHLHDNLFAPDEAVEDLTHFKKPLQLVVYRRDIIGVLHAYEIDVALHWLLLFILKDNNIKRIPQSRFLARGMSGMEKR